MPLRPDLENQTFLKLLESLKEKALTSNDKTKTIFSKKLLHKWKSMCSVSTPIEDAIMRQQIKKKRKSMEPELMTLTSLIIHNALNNTFIKFSTFSYM